MPTHQNKPTCSNKTDTIDQPHPQQCNTLDVSPASRVVTLILKQNKFFLKILSISSERERGPTEAAQGHETVPALDYRIAQCRMQPWGRGTEGAAKAVLGNAADASACATCSSACGRRGAQTLCNVTPARRGVGMGRVSVWAGVGGSRACYFGVWLRVGGDDG